MQPRNPELSGLVGVTLWFKPHISPIAETRPAPRNVTNGKASGFADELRADLLARGLVANDRWGKRNATQIAQAVERAGVHSFEELKAANLLKLANRAKLSGIKGDILARAMN